MASDESELTRDKRMELQGDEFHKLALLSEAHNALHDDCPEIRHKYEAALKDFIAALAANNRLPAWIKLEHEYALSSRQLNARILNGQFMVHDENGVPLPCQQEVHLSQPLGKCALITVTFVVDGRNVVLRP